MQPFLLVMLSLESGFLSGNKTTYRQIDRIMNAGSLFESFDEGGKVHLGIIIEGQKRMNEYLWEF